MVVVCRSRVGKFASSNITAGHKADAPTVFSVAHNGRLQFLLPRAEQGQIRRQLRCCYWLRARWGRQDECSPSVGLFQFPVTKDGTGQITQATPLKGFRLRTPRRQPFLRVVVGSSLPLGPV